MNNEILRDSDLEELFLLEMEAIDSARTNFLDFITYTKPDYEVHWHHALMARELQDFFEGPCNRLMIFAPPRHGKSEIVSRRFPAWVFGKDPDIPIIATSYGDSLAARMNRDVQRIIDQPEYNMVFPKTRLEGGQVRTGIGGKYLRNSDIFEIVGHRGIYRSAGVGAGITGMGAQLAIIDDPIKNAADAKSKVMRESQWEWLTNVLMTRLEGRNKLLLTLTRWHEDDIAGRLIKLAENDKTADQWKILKLPAMLEEKSYYDPREIGEALWPKKFPIERLMKIKASNMRTWTALFQQRPTAQTGNIIKREWFRFYRGSGPKHFDKVIQTWDLAFKAGKNNDFVVGQVWGKMGADAYLLAQIRARLTFPETIEAFIRLSSQFPKARLKKVEEKANGAALIQVLKSKIPGIVPFNPDKFGDKVSRANLVTDFWRSGNVYVPDPTEQPWVYEFIEELVNFDGGESSLNDDQVDSMTCALIEFFVEAQDQRLHNFLTM